MSFSMQQAIDICTANIKERKTVQRTMYKLYYSNHKERAEGSYTGTTVKSLINEFREKGGAYRYAIIVKISDEKPIRFFDRALSRKFFSMTRKKK